MNKLEYTMTNIYRILANACNVKEKDTESS